MFIAAEAVRRVSGLKPWNDICRERLFNPIGGDSLSFALSGPEPGPMDAFESKNMLGHPAGGCVGTLVDMLKVLQLHLNGGLWQGRVLIKPEAFKEMHTIQYAAEIAKDAAAGKPIRHENWGLGWLLRGPGGRPPAAHWFGFGDHASAAMFGHAGIDTIMGVGDPALDAGYAFVITKSIGDERKAGLLRKEVANRFFEALA
jgi:CubicO group peptidase (beta-lactamase class C family)